MTQVSSVPPHVMTKGKLVVLIAFLILMIVAVILFKAVIPSNPAESRKTLYSQISNAEFEIKRQQLLIHGYEQQLVANLKKDGDANGMTPTLSLEIKRLQGNIDERVEKQGFPAEYTPEPPKMLIK